MKGINLVNMDLKNIKRFFKMSITFFAKETQIFCIESKDNEWKFTDMKNTGANDIVIKNKYLS